MPVVPLTEFDFCVLRFKVAKLLKTSHRKIKSIDLMGDGSVVVSTTFVIRIAFSSVKEINDDFAKFYPDVEVPTQFTSTDGEHRVIKMEGSPLVPLAV